MNKIVIKIGGSNLKNIQDIPKIVSVVKRYRTPVVIVVSAMYGVTDLLAGALKEVDRNGQTISPLKQALLNLHQEFLVSSISDQDDLQSAIAELKRRINALGKYLVGVHCLGKLPAFAEDQALSYGERLSSLVMTHILRASGIPAGEISPEELGLITDGEFGNGTVDIHASIPGVQEKLSGTEIHVVPGFYGIAADGQTTLLGRGGTDYSAAAIARCLDALSVDIWKDVPGFMSADPKLVKDTRNIPRLTYQEAAELSYFGAKILHPRTFEPLIDKGIPIRLFNIHAADPDGHPQTVVGEEAEIIPGVIKSVTYSDDFGVLQLRGPGVGIKPGIMARVTSALSDSRINIKSIITAQTCINILLSQADLSPGYKLISTLGLSAVDTVFCLEDISLIAVVGEGLLEKPGVAFRALGAISRHKINVLIISAGASPVATYFVVAKKDRPLAIDSIHKEFFNENHR